ncbi:SAP domain-containing protein [Sphingobacterium multivorum]|uniref:SAP domain-containing protein n=1 Tax=Sphingobacterium multivorum TaxID=28454 RepID=UPI0028AF9D50|nr:SAP domain-containing protein [Sphingobacterium multivorum]
MDYKKMQAAKLKQLCKDRKLDTNGTRNTMIERLKDWDINNDFQLRFENSSVTEPTPSLKSNTKLKTLFIQIKISNISHYFNSGLIYPIALEESEIYVKENRKLDIFTIFPQHIILTPNPINEFSDDDALLEIITDNLDISEISKTSMFYCSSPIPLSRVKSILFKTEKSKIGFVSSAKTFPDFFVEEEICYVSSTLPPLSVNLSSITLETNELIDKWYDIMDRYDKILGMFAFMKNAGIFFADREGLFEEYTTNYFSALSVVNRSVTSKVSKDIGLFKYIIFPGEIETSTVQRFLFQKILKGIYNNIEIDLSFAQKILNTAIESGLANISERNELFEISSLFNQIQEKQISYKDVLNHPFIRRNYPVLALLYLSKFPNKSRQHTDKQAVRNNFIEKNSSIRKGTAEFLMAVLGLYYGYKSMIKEDTNVNVVDPLFLQLTKCYQSIKFRITSNIDRFVIESSYWFAISGSNVMSSYSYLGSNNTENKNFIKEKIDLYDYVDESYFNLNSKVNIYRRINKLDRFLESLDQVYSSSIPANSALLQNLVSNYGIKKSHLFELIKENISKIDLKNIEHLIEFDKKQIFKK